MRKHAYLWITLTFFLISIGLHWWLGWHAYVQEAAEHSQPVELSSYLTEIGRDTFENWQSEFLQLIWQVVGLAFFLYVGSPASKENDDRLEAKVDAVLRIIGGQPADKLIKDLDRTYMRDEGHAQPHGHEEEIAKTAGCDIEHVAVKPAKA